MKKTMTTNAEWMQENGYKFKDLRIYINFSNDKKWDYGIKIAKTNVNVHVKGDGPLNALTRWLDAEHAEPILDDAEKRYLSEVIRPFKDRTLYVKKTYPVRGYEQILIMIKSTTNVGAYAKIPFPFFKVGEMYKGMEQERKYTLEELKLYEER